MNRAGQNKQELADFVRRSRFRQIHNKITGASKIGTNAITTLCAKFSDKIILNRNLLCCYIIIVSLASCLFISCSLSPSLSDSDKTNNSPKKTEASDAPITITLTPNEANTLLNYEIKKLVIKEEVITPIDNTTKPQSDSVIVKENRQTLTTIGWTSLGLGFMGFLLNPDDSGKSSDFNADRLSSRQHGALLIVLGWAAAKILPDVIFPDAHPVPAGMEKAPPLATTSSILYKIYTKCTVDGKEPKEWSKLSGAKGEINLKEKFLESIFRDDVQHRFRGKLPDSATVSVQLEDPPISNEITFNIDRIMPVIIDSIDWTKGSISGLADSAISNDFSINLISNTAKIDVIVTNTGKADIFRLRARIKSDDVQKAFDDWLILFGKISEGESKSRSIELTIPPEYKVTPTLIGITIEFEGDNIKPVSTREKHKNIK